MKKIRPFFSIFCILLVLLLSGHFLFFNAYIKLQKSDFQSELLALKNGKTRTLIFSSKTIYQNNFDCEWKENNNEIVFKGKYHEVLSIKKVHTGFLVTIIEDKNENDLFDAYDSINKKSKLALHEITQSIQSINYLENQNLTVPKLFSKNLMHWPNFMSLVQTIFQAPLLKPPGVFLNS